MREEIKKWVVNDYFTPNIKAEVIFDTLLTPYIEGIVKSQCGLDEVKFITKEMSIEDEREDNRGKKIDYILTDKKYIYMVELKTTKGSIGTEQWQDYFAHCLGDGKTFGNVFGEKLLTIGSGKANISDHGQNESDKPWNERVKNVFSKIASKSKLEINRGTEDFYAETAKELLKRKGWGSTYKYLYTMGQLLDKASDDRDFWEKPLRLIYITPDGDSIVPKHYDLSEEEKAVWEKFYVSPDHTQNTSVSLKKVPSYLRKTYKEEEYALLVSDIIEEIYGEEEA